MKRNKLYREIASRLLAIENCERTNNEEWRERHSEIVKALCDDFMPSGSGIDSGSALLEESTPEKLKFSADFHHMNESGMYDGWSEHIVTVTASLVFTLNITISGRNRNDIKEYLHQTFAAALETEIAWSDKIKRYVLPDYLATIEATTAPTIDKSLQRAFRFFLKNAGYVVGSHAATALALARAEQWAEESEVYFTWEQDSQPYEDALGDHEYWCSDARRVKAGYSVLGEYVGRNARKSNDCDHNVATCLMRDKSGNVLASLSGILDPSNDYMRVVCAELALEAQEGFAQNWR